MKDLNNLAQAIIVLIVGIALLGAIGMNDLASQIGRLSILIIIGAVIVIIAKFVIDFF